MARKISLKKKTPAKAASKGAKARSSSPVRNTAMPKVAPKPVASSAVRSSPAPTVAAKAAPAAPAAAAKPAKKLITNDMIAVRAYEISCSGTGGSELDNWLRAERELRGA